MKTYYQPRNKYCELPEELADNMVFTGIGEAVQWLEDNDYDSSEYGFDEYHDGDIPNMIPIDGYGYFLDGTGSVGAYNTEKDLDEGYDMLQDTIKRAMEKTGEKRLFLKNFSCILYEDYNTLGLDEPSEFGDECPEIVSIDIVSAYDTDSEIIPLENITDYDDFVMLNDAICRAYGV